MTFHMAYVKIESLNRGADEQEYRAHRNRKAFRTMRTRKGISAEAHCRPSRDALGLRENTRIPVTATVKRFSAHSGKAKEGG